MRLFAAMIALVLTVAPVIAEDIVDVKDPDRLPDIVEGAVVRVIDGAIDLWPPPINHFIANDDGCFAFRVGYRYEDRTPRRTIMGRVEVQIHQEQGPYGCGRWVLLWSGTRETGDWLRHPRLRDQDIGPFDSGLVTQTAPVVRYRIDMQASTHGTKQRAKRMSAITSVVKLPDRGPEELAMTLLVCHEAWLVYHDVGEVFDRLKRRHIDRPAVRAALARLQYTMSRLDRLTMALPGDRPLKDRVAWGSSLTERATTTVGLPRMDRRDIMMPYFCVLDSLVVEALRTLRDDVDHEKAMAACERAIRALEYYGYDDEYVAENVRHELKDVERILARDDQGYAASLERAQQLFETSTGYRAWPPAEGKPEQKYLDETFARAGRFFDVPRHAAGVQVASMRALRGLLSL